MVKQMCQSCGRPLNDQNKGTEADGSSLSALYCNLCYMNGAFKDPNMTIEQMKNTYVKAMQEMHFPKFLASWLASMQLPKLKRWQKNVS